MTKTKQPKPVKAWAIVDTHDELMSRGMNLCIYGTRQEARKYCNVGERPARVEIKVLK